MSTMDGWKALVDKGFGVSSAGETHGLDLSARLGVLTDETAK